MFTNRDNILVASGNQALVDKNVKLFNADGSLNIEPGQIGIFDAFTHLAVDQTNIASSKDIYIAVGIDKDGDGMAEEIRKSAGEHWNKCSTDVAQTEPPRNECPQIWDFVFDCIECNTDYSLKVQMEGVEWMPYFANQHLPTFTFNHYTKCCTECEETTPSVACSAFVDDIISQVAQTANEAANLIDQQYPFTAVALTNESYEITVPCINDKPAALKAITINGNLYDVCAEITVNADGSMNPSQFGVIKEYLEGEEDITVTFYKKCTDTCYTLLITSNDALTVNLAMFLTEGQDCGDAGVESPETALDPLTVDGVTYSCGIRFIGHIFPQECGCFPPKEYKSTRGTKMRIFPLSGFDCKWDTNLVQELQISEGQGADIRWREYKQQLGGQGRTYDSYHTHYGKLGVYGDRVRESVMAECTDYCQYQFIYHAKSYPLAPMGWTNNTHLQTTVVIPNDSSTTKTEFETVINAWLVTGTCPLDTISCDNDTPVINSGFNTIDPS